nr:hypothetical protein Iba_chr06cCG11850 [Ipomoea batatas]
METSRRSDVRPLRRRCLEQMSWAEIWSASRWPEH